jgi:hypothetical protein
VSLLRPTDDTQPWKGGYAPYDLIKELCIAVGVIGLLAVVLTVLFSSPDDKPSTIAQWSREQPVNFIATAAKELDGTSDTAEYGPPYNHKSGSVQHFLFLHPQRWLGVSHPINTAEDYVIDPLRTIPGDPALASAVSEYQAAPEKTKKEWGEAYAKPLEEYETAIEEKKAPPKTVALNPSTGAVTVQASGGLLGERAEAQHLLGEQWGMMNETGSYPGQAWLWLYALWYQVEPIKSSPNADIQVMLIMGLLSLAFVCIPFLPGIRSLPRKVPIYRLIWKEHYRSQQSV